MEKKFYDLKEGDIIYAVYNKDNKFEYVIEKCKILINKENERIIKSSDRHDNDIYTIKGYYIEIDFNGQNYNRYYDKFYNDRKHMTMIGPATLGYPVLEIFVDKNDAKEYFERECNQRINYLKCKIDDYLMEINKLEKCLQIYV